MSVVDVIKKRSEFVFVGRIGARSKTQNIVVLCVKRRDDPNTNPRVGYTASRRVGNAVKRNKAKRRLRSLVSLKRLFIKRGFSFVFIATPKTVDCDFLELSSDFEYCLKKSIQRAERNNV